MIHPTSHGMMRDGCMDGRNFPVFIEEDGIYDVWGKGSIVGEPFPVTVAEDPGRGRGSILLLEGNVALRDFREGYQVSTAVDGNRRPFREGVEDFLDGGAILEIAIVEGLDAFKEGANDSGGEEGGVHDDSSYGGFEHRPTGKK